MPTSDTPAAPWHVIGLPGAASFCSLPAAAVIVGMVSFRTTEVTGIFMIYEHTARFFAGALVLLLAVVGGALVEGGCQLAVATFSFRMLSTGALRMFLDDIMNGFGTYPMKIFPSATRPALTFVLPLAFVAYLPTGVLIGHTGGLHVTPWLAYGAPLAGPLIAAAAHRLWRTQLRHYQGTGT
ncbi:ABC-2 family transporter protein [Streptomyces sp. MP131-18]|uniref:ABC-2 family transporter protein n=1 Tax=Streptomyces sp. MP131-18 TaxID=1857892 RepID=UPI0009D3F043|nr:ABC-2 family transporter protein [Streptomyces sp. MP131-18]ONK11443.1 ABC-type uncharacterized transport system, permease component [Streptomyces sp. MP131-18]